VLGALALEVRIERVELGLASRFGELALPGVWNDEGHGALLQSETHR
jgi:hypothetical protein